MSEMFDWDPKERWKSNHGTGPLEARILSIHDGVAEMERKPIRGGRWVGFTLPLSYLTRPRCGWQRVGSVGEKA